MVICSAERVPIHAALHRPVSDGLPRVRRVRLPPGARPRLQSERQEDLQLDVLLRRSLGAHLARLCRLQQRTGNDGLKWSWRKYLIIDSIEALIELIAVSISVHEQLRMKIII